MKLFLTILFLIMLFPVSGSSDIYKYVDKDGTPRFVDDMSKVPEEYQDQVVRQSVPKSDAGPENDAAKETSSQALKDAKDALKKMTSGDEKKKSQPAAATNKHSQALLKEKAALDAEYAALMKEKDEISKATQEWSKRYKTRRRKGVARKKLKELEVAQMEWEKKYQAWQDKKTALDNKMQ